MRFLLRDRSVVLFVCALLSGLTQPADVQSSAHLEWAREVARQSMSLYKNANNALPLPKDARLALVGGQWADAYLLTGTQTHEMHLSMVFRFALLSSQILSLLIR
jgi:beta-glucosidase-like glycosyl hydrolase